MSYKKANLEDLVTTVKTLRGPDGCPWDRRQSTESMVKYLDSEYNELLEAISNRDTDNICEEIGDLLFTLVMIAEIEEENGNFTLHTVLHNINKKLIRRHPHVFAGVEISSEQELREQWEKIKALEKSKK
ncbi:MazG nucleotide pyrophosphohydrolase domain-containing protein [Desulfopila sp. IMCC35008]|uniref:MazG nucleotide pyrophosphohydrolase domain-containing protein n=1 Tax=Desulfopila sp. IMCC35008 TaxID=2653858 RepID=UPI0013D0FCDC|nr:MazG nucleotide pyrophosphohydrolase domain-containing protein [Desulfopila sp. IMCC35008]